MSKYGNNVLGFKRLIHVRVCTCIFMCSKNNIVDLLYVFVHVATDIHTCVFAVSWQPIPLWVHL